MWKDFKDFAMKGNIIDMAIGVIIGGAFGKIVSSLVNDIIMPIFARITGKIDFSNMFIALDGNKYQSLNAAKDAGVITLNFGVFLNNIIEFLIIAFSIFIVVRQIQKLTKKEEVIDADPTTKECKYCMSEINIKATRCPNCTSEL